jgi:hypothetical protein
MAIYYWRGLTGSTWGTAGNWSTGSTSTLGGAVPTVADDLIFDANSSACTVDTTTRVCKSINFSAYTNTITMTFGINVAANTSTGVQVILGSGMTINGSGAINIARVNAILRSNGKVWPNDLGIGTIGSLANNTIYTLQDNWVFGGSFISGYGTGLSYTLSGGNLTIGGSFFMNGQQFGNGLGNITLTGSGTISGTGYIDLYSNFTINSSGSYNLGNFNMRRTNLIYSSGTINTISGTTVTYGVGSTTINVNGSTSLSPPLSSSTGINFFNFSTRSELSAPTITTLTTPICVINTFNTEGSFLNGSNFVLNGSNIHLNRNFSTSARTISGSSQFIFQGTGTYFHDSSTPNLFGPGVGSNFIVNTSGTMTVISQYLVRRGGFFNVISGTVIPNGAILMITDSFISSFSSPGVVWGGLYLDSFNPTNGVSQFSAVTDFQTSGEVRTFQTTNQPAIYGNVLLSGSCRFNSITTGYIFGTGTIRMRGAGFLSMSGSSGTVNQGYLACNVSFESGSNQIDIIGTLRYRDGTITYTSGVINATNNTLNLLAASTLNTEGMTWGTITNLASLTVTLNSTLSANTITGGNSISFGGSFGFYTNNLNYTIAGGGLTLGAGNFYYVRQSLFARGTLASRAIFSSSTVSLVSYLTLENSATQDVGFTSATRINSSLGQTIYTRKGVLTTTTNWSLLANPVTVYKSFISQ